MTDTTETNQTSQSPSPAGTTDLSSLPRWPRVEARTHPDGSGELTINGTSHPIATADAAEARAAMTRWVAELAGKIGRPIRVATHAPDGSWPIVVHPNGTIEADPTTQPTPVKTRRRRTAAARPDQPVPDRTASPLTPADRPEPVSTADQHSAPPATAPAAAAPPAAAQLAPTSTTWTTPTPAGVIDDAPVNGPAAQSTLSWLTQPAGAHSAAVEPATLPTVDDLLRSRPAAAPGPAEQGWRGAVRRLSLGVIRPRPGAAEAAHRAAAAEVRRSLTGPKTVVVINPKGGAHKTTATLLLAATFGRQRGGYTLAWDNNETRGTLGWRAQPADHARTATDLLDDLDRFATATRARVGDLDHYVRPQRGAHFDVLASDEDAAAAATIDADAFARLHATLTRFYRVVVVDTGNNMRAPNWGAAVDAADQLVIVSTIREDTAATAAWLVDGLRARGLGGKVAQAVTLLAAPDSRPADAALRARLADHFGQLTRTVLDVPYDPALASGSPVDLDRLHRRTREAWLRASAAVAQGL